MNGRQLIGQRYIGVETVERWSSRLRETAVTISQRVDIVDKLHSAGEPLHSHFQVNEFNFGETIISEIFSRFQFGQFEKKIKKISLRRVEWTLHQVSEMRDATSAVLIG